MNDRTELGVAMIGHAFMGAAHSQAWRVADRFFDLPLEPVMRVVCGRDSGRAAAAAERFGSVEWEDAGMDRLVGAPEALEFVRRLAFDAPEAAFDAAFSGGGQS